MGIQNQQCTLKHVARELYKFHFTDRVKCLPAIFFDMPQKRNVAQLKMEMREDGNGNENEKQKQRQMRNRNRNRY